METEPAFGTQKRAADRDACTQDHSTATKMLQQLLPMLRPHQTRDSRTKLYDQSPNFTSWTEAVRAARFITLARS